MSKKMSRRSFLKMTAAGAVGAAGMDVFAPLSAIAEEKQTAADESGIRWDLEADIIVLSAVRLVGGTVHALNNRQLDLLMEAAERLFNLTENCEIVGTVSPGFFNALPTEAMKAHGVSVLMDVPSFDREECQRRGMPYRGALSFGDVTDAGVSVFGVRTLCGLAGRTETAWASGWARSAALTDMKRGTHRISACIWMRTAISRKSARAQNQYKTKRSRGSAQRRCPRLLF